MSACTRAVSLIRIDVILSLLEGRVGGVLCGEVLSQCLPCPAAGWSIVPGPLSFTSSHISPICPWVQTFHLCSVTWLCHVFTFHHCAILQHTLFQIACHVFLARIYKPDLTFLADSFVLTLPRFFNSGRFWSNSHGMIDLCLFTANRLLH